MTAEEIISDISAGWNLGNSLDTYISVVTDDTNAYEMSWGNPVTTREMIQTVHAAGFNAVRIPVTWEQKLDENDRVKDFWMDRVQEIVDYAYDEGMYVILNIHHDTNWGWLRASESSWEKYRERFRLLWEQIAERFAGYDCRLMFEGFNEIMNEEHDWGFWDEASRARRNSAIRYTNLWNQFFVDTVRSTGGNNLRRVLICNTYAGSGDETVLSGDVRFEIPKDTVDDRLITAVHHYRPYRFAGDPGSEDPAEGMTSVYDSKIHQELEDSFDILNKNLSGPIIIGEWGAYNKGNTEDRIRFSRDFVKAVKKRKMACFLWDSGVQNFDFGYAYRAEGTWWFPEIIEAVMEGAGVSEYSIPPCKDYSGSSNLAADPFRFTSWNADDAGVFVSPVSHEGATFRVRDSGTQSHGILLSYKPVALKSGETYNISFDISCQGIGEIGDAQLQMGYLKPDFSADVIDFEAPMTVTDTVRHYEFEYISSWDYDATVYFWVQTGEHAEYSVRVSGLYIEKKQA